MLRSGGWAFTWAILRLAMASSIAGAVIGQAMVTIPGAASAGRDVATTTVNFFSFFTILSNIGAVAVLAWAALWYATRGRRADGMSIVEPRGLAVVLAAVTTYMVITGVVYNTLLRDIQLPQGATVGWSNEILHVAGPLFLLADLFVGPGRRVLPWRAVGEVAIFPIVWVVYTLIRGPLTVDPGGRPPYWYPYPFLNPNNPDLPFPGYGGVAFWVVVIATAIVAVGALVVAVGRRRGRTSPSSARPVDHD